MGNRIRGITVEIGGDTTKLDKALAGTNKNLNSTQKNLKDVERLLKLDPGNTTLLEQRQRLLAQSVETTREKLETLRAAAEQADEALSRGTAYEERYAPLREALSEAKAQLKELQDQQEAMNAAFASGEISEEEYQNYNDTLKETEERLDSLKEAKRNLDAEFEGSKMNQEQYDNLQREIIETEQNLEELEEQARNSSAALGKIGAVAGDVSSTAGKISDATRGLSLAAGGLLTAMVGSVTGTEELRSDLSKLETNARLAGVGLDATRDAMQQLNSVSDETDSSVEALSNLLQAGVTESNLQRAVENLAGAAISFPDTVKIESLADSLQETLATGSATGQFAEVLDRLGVGADNFNAELSQVPGTASKLNFALDTLQHQGLAGVYNSWMENNEAMVENKNATLELQMSLASLAEKMQPLMTAVTELAGASLDWFNGLSEKQRGAVVALLAIVAAISPVAGAIAGVANAVKIVTENFGTMQATASKVFSFFASNPMLAAILLIAAAVALIALNWDKVKETAKNTIDAIIGFIEKGINAVKRFFGILSDGEDTSGIKQSSVAPRRTVFSRTALQNSLDGYPAFASGGVFAPNSPMLGVLGDHPTEYEVAAPESMLRDTFLDALSSSGLMGRSTASSASQTVVLNLDGRTFARLVVPYLKAEYARMGINLLDR